MRLIPFFFTLLALLAAGCVAPAGREAPPLDAQEVASEAAFEVITKTYEASWTAQVGSPVAIMSLDGSGWPALDVRPFLAANATFEWTTAADTGPMRVGFQDSHGERLWEARADASPATFAFPADASALLDASHFFAGPTDPGAAVAVDFTLTLEFLVPAR